MTKTIYAAYIYDAQTSHATTMTEPLDDYTFFDTLEGAQKFMFEELGNLYARDTEETEQSLREWLVKNEIWPEGATEFPLDVTMNNGDGTIGSISSTLLWAVDLWLD
jgi:hypothetical protein